MGDTPDAPLCVARRARHEAKRSGPVRIGEDSNSSGSDNADDLRRTHVSQSHYAHATSRPRPRAFLLAAGPHRWSHQTRLYVAGPLRWQRGQAAHTATVGLTCASQGPRCHLWANYHRVRTEQAGADTPRGRPHGRPLGVSHQHSASCPRRLLNNVSPALLGPGPCRIPL